MNTARRRGMRVRIRVVAMTAIGCLCAVALAACVGLPTGGGPVRADVSAVESAPGYVVSPDSPVPGASPEQIIRGFISAGSGPSGNFATAREFLSSSFATVWNPEAAVLVFSNSPTLSSTGGSTFDARFVVAAQVDASGVYSQSNRGQTTSGRYSLVKERGQWRISSAPDGVAIVEPDFSVVFQERTLFFYSLDHRFLVPDTRWFPNGSASATRIVTALLAGPRSGLSGAVTTEIPEGTKLTVDSVTTQDGTAQVSLSPEVLTLDAAGQSRVLEQLESSLSSIQSITSTTISVGSVQLTARAPATPLPTAVEPESRVVVANELGEFGYYFGGKLELITSLSDAIGALKPSVFALRDGSAAAANAEGLWLVAPNQVPRQLAKGTFTQPTIDPYGYIWSTSGGRLRVFDPSGSPVTLGTPGELSNVSRVAVDATGVRVAFQTRGSDSTGLIVAALPRDASGAPIAIRNTVHLDTADGSAVALAWVGGQQVIAAVRSGSGPVSSTISTVGGPAVSMADLANVRTIVAGAGRDSIRALTSDGVVSSARGTGWLAVATGIRAVGYSWN